MPEVEGFFGIALLFLWVFAIFDVIASDRTLIRNLPKELWLLIVVILPDLGAIAWLIMGRPQGARLVPGSTERGAAPTHRGTPRAYIGPEDAPDFTRRAEEHRLHAWEEDLKRREEEMRRRESGDEP